MTATNIDAVLNLLDPPVWIITATSGERACGLVVTSLMSVSIVPEEARLALAVAKQHYTHQLIEESRRVAIHLPGQSQLPDVVHFGLQSGHQVDKFADRCADAWCGRAPYVEHCLARLTADVEANLDMGDRTLFLCRVTGTETSRKVEPPMTVKHLVAHLTSEQKAELGDLLRRDAAIDRDAIHGWREQLGLPH